MQTEAETKTKPKSKIAERLDHLFRYMGVRSRREGCKRLGLDNTTVSRWVNEHQRPSPFAIKIIEAAEREYIRDESDSKSVRVLPQQSTGVQV